MTLVVCVDPRYGLSFGSKRPTIDSTIMDDIVSQSKKNDHAFFCTAYSRPYVSDSYSRLSLNNDILVLDQMPPQQDLPDNSTLFIETGSSETIDELLQKADNVVIYQWENTYPYTKQFPDIGKMTDTWSCTEDIVLQGHSHNNVHRKTYKRNIDILMDDGKEFINDTHRKRYYKAIANSNLTTDIRAAMFVLTSMPFLYMRIKNNGYIHLDSNWIDFQSIFEKMRTSSGETLMLSFAANIYNGSYPFNLYDLLCGVDNDMRKIIVLTLHNFALKNE